MHDRTIQVLNIIAQETGDTPEELRNNPETEFADLGIDKLLSQAIISQIHKTMWLNMPSDLFESCPTVASLAGFLEESEPKPIPSTVPVYKQATSPSTERQAALNQAVVDQPLSIRLQGNSKGQAKTIFLLPDGSGSAMSYARIPFLGPGVCLYGLNSPFLANPETFPPIPDIAPIWAAEIRRLQPKGPYILGGWSAGGYYCFEVAKHMMLNETEADGRPVVVEKLVLIDSPCRTVFEALPMIVVETLSNQGLMGNWGHRGAPQWLLDHFAATIARVEEYKPSPLVSASADVALPKVFIIWATSGVYAAGESAASGLDTKVKVTKFMLEDRLDFGPNGWDVLFPRGTEVAIATSPGTHFTLVSPPNRPG
ncbi:Conidial pigment polyketide synthase alb1 [Colletotrichum higginsianum]|uniref:Conidial pigment polyketide synthase alb1 n=1 Tax=Colletotrichum higginsianum TaxID=80884 RepID=A0A4T0VEH1_9PEZI|nr:Conidial pigment polyketide synthase alb1 [Colletotrichum higginsianum]